MRCSSFIFSLLASITVAFAMVAMIMMSSQFAWADQDGHGSSCSCPNAHGGSVQPKPKLADLTRPNIRHREPKFGKKAQIAALEIVQYALTEVGDGSSYVWHHGQGKLSGIVQPTSSFKDASGKVCRHFTVMYSTGTFSKQTETVACRQKNGIWKLDG